MQQHSVHDVAPTSPPLGTTQPTPVGRAPGTASPARPRPSVAASARARPSPPPPRTDPPAVTHRDARQVVGAAVLATAALAAFDVALTGRLSMFFDLCFVLVGLSAAIVVRRKGLFAVGVLPPLLLAAVVAVLAALFPQALTASHLAFVSTWLTGLAVHGAALVATHGTVLALVGARAAQRTTGRGAVG